MSSMGKVLVVEDKASMRDMLVLALQEAEYEVESASNGEQALSALKASPFDLVVSDLKMPKMDGQQLLKASRDLHAPPAFIMITAHGSIPEAVEAINNGAFDFVEKPFDLEELEYKVAEAIGSHAPLGSGRASLENLIGASAQMCEVAETVQRVAPSKLPVLVTGESGSGKKSVAQALVALSPRADETALVLDASADDFEHGVESALFGHEKGAVEGSKKAHVGVLEEAAGGTLVIVNVERLPAPAQRLLHQYLQEHRFERLGGSKSIEVDTRIVATTRENVSELVASGAFREDLYYRLKGVTVHMPPLRERQGDIALLVDHYLAKAKAEHAKDVSFSPRVAKILNEYAWPGNVRELISVIEASVVMAAGDTIVESEIAEEVRNPGAAKGASLTRDLESIEKERLREALEQQQWNQTRTAKALGIGRTALQYKMQKYGLKKPS